MDQFGVEPDELEGSGRAARHFASALREELPKIAVASDAAVAGLADWKTARALAACAQAWSDALKSLAEGLDSAGGKLVRTADNYRDGDEVAHHTIRQLNPLDLFRTGGA
ncbi:hypothetical protein AB0C51_25880 [Streptomyces pathocidini]|uniref:hypothetical protein n=1 Tax=Streptomyces pathocidini TaxID=1650571 RepID=UPI0033D720A5